MQGGAAESEGGVCPWHKTFLQGYMCANQEAVFAVAACVEAVFAVAACVEAVFASLPCSYCRCCMCVVAVLFVGAVA